MPIYEITPDDLRTIPTITFSEAGIHERTDLQRLLRNRIEVVAPETIVIAEEFGEWEDSRRRIDLLAVDKAANLVVIELKRSEDGGHMDLQALRYAAMVSTMTFENAAEAYSRYLKANHKDEDGTQALLNFLEWSGPDEEAFAQDVRIVLVAAEFSKELTTAVLWLNTYELDIRCVRLRPYGDNGRILLDVEEVIPLPDAIDYQTKVSIKSREERIARASNRDFKKYDVTIDGKTTPNLAKRNAIFLVVKHLCQSGVDAQSLTELVPQRAHTMFMAVDGRLSPEDFIEAATVLRADDGYRFVPERWFCDEGQLIYQKGKTYALSNQWGGKWHIAMDSIIQAFPDAKISYRAADAE